ncbi:hypothetical protein BKA62DRAFT_739167 [Auriculariales sp. MPI-PUGE-AT-0066]|nr:hypothetical protein BKA62DRAFT_739167 [Auriculariales sp. MPI-PUGE-AT-0066]
MHLSSSILPLSLSLRVARPGALFFALRSSVHARAQVPPRCIDQRAFALALTQRNDAICAEMTTTPFSVLRKSVHCVTPAVVVF